MDIRALSAASDHDAVFGLFCDAADYVQLEDGGPPTRVTVAAFFEDRPPNVPPNDTIHFGVFDHGRLVGITGSVFGYPDPNDAYIGLMLLSSKVRGTGVGPKLLHHATQLARQKGARRQLIAVLDQNPRGRAFWEREGFVLEKTFPESGDGHIRHRMTRAI